MTMFTPSGAGARPPRRRGRGRRTAITLILALALLAGAAAYAWRNLLPGDPGATTAAPGCAPTTVSAPATPAAEIPPPAAAVPAEKIVVNVYNATDRGGLASDVAAAMRKRGFRVRAVANDPADRKVGATMEVRHGPRGEAAARTVVAHAPGAAVVLDRRPGRAVDLVLGEQYEALATPEQAAAALTPPAATAETAAPAPTC